MSDIPQSTPEYPAWVRFRSLVDLDGANLDSPEAAHAREAMERTPQLTALLADIADWPGVVLNSHKSAQQTFHSLSFAAELGVSAKHPAIAMALERILSRMQSDGLPRLPMTYPVHFGGTGTETWSWALCDAPIILKALVRFGLGGEKKVQAGVDSIFSLSQPFGWPCAVAPELGTFRGPGKKTDPCPYATLVSLDLAAACMESPQGPASWKKSGKSTAVLAGIEALLTCWERSREWHPYIFYAGDDFRKLKAPLLWYDILHVADTLSRFEAARTDPRFAQIIGTILEKKRGDGSYMAESVYQPYKNWDFGQKKKPSPWIEFLVRRIERRMR